MGNRFKLGRSSKKAKSPVTHIISLDRDFSRLDSLPQAVCTCGWFTEENSNLLILGRAAKKHSIKTGHIMRPH